MNKTSTKAIGMMLMACMLCLPCAVGAKTYLEKHGNAVRLNVNGKPMLIIGGELSNSAATSVDDINEVMPRMKAQGLNTVLVPAQWDLLEPREGEFDYSLIDATVNCARENDLKVVFLWFGAWKNSMSCYAPLWFKQDSKRFPRAVTKEGKPLEIASSFSENVLKADNAAFTALLRHIKAIDPAAETVVMVQIENEIGMLENARDHSPAAEKAYSSAMPNSVAKALGKKTGTTWRDAFGDDIYGEEQFMAYYYAVYVEQLAQTARSIYDVPLFVNAAMNSRGRKPGEYPSAGPLAHLEKIWKLGAPTVDILAPDIYDDGFKAWASQYHTKDNPLFIPETRCGVNAAVRALYTFGEHSALGYCPFGIDQADAASRQAIGSVYKMLHEMTPLLLKYQGTADMRGVLFDMQDKETVINYDPVVLVCRHNFTLPWDSRATNGSIWPEGGAIVLRISKFQYLIAGNGVVVEFKSPYEAAYSPSVAKAALGEDGFAEAGNGNATTAAKKTFNGKRIGIGSVDQVSVNPDGSFKYIRRDNGDQDHQGRHARISVGETKMLLVTLYEY